MIQMQFPLNQQQKTKKRKSFRSSDDFFKHNGNMAHRISRSVKHELELCSTHSKDSLIDGLLIERCKSIVMFNFVLLVVFVFERLVIN